MWIKTVVGVVAVAAVLVAGALAFGSFRWKRATGGLIARLGTSGLAAPVSRFDPRELERLPPPVARYLAAALTAGQPLFPVMDVHDTAEIAAGALQRYLAEAVWFPTRLLPSQGVEWTPVDDSTAVATLTTEGRRVALEFRFDAAGDVVGVFTPSRYREVHGAFEPTPWAGRFKAHAERNGMRIPLEAEVEWQLADRRLPYWRGRLVDVRYRSAP